MNVLETNERAQWFAVRTRSNREAVVTTALTRKGYNAWYPRFRDHKAPGKLGSAAFPGYVFCQLDVINRLPVLMIPGIVGLVSSGRTPLPIDETEMASLRTVMQSTLAVGPCGYLKIADRVRITTGPLAGAEGCIVRADRNRLVVSITLLQRSVSVEVANEWLEKTCSKAA
jgi:transcription antitermination factor NusG